MKLSSALLLTLGHNSSAVYYDGNSALGYEEERLNCVKSSSAYPRLAIDEILKNVEIAKGSYIFVSHWFDDFSFDLRSSKYFDKEHFDSLVEKYSLKKILLNDSFTHHDAHAWSVLSFMCDQWNERHNEIVNENDLLHVIVADGFGNSQEVISVYSLTAKGDFKSGLRLENRIYGYQNSLGLMYQYATSYCGMKENQDEYKFLGYETYVSSILNKNQLSKLRYLAEVKAEKTWSEIKNNPDGRRLNFSSNKNELTELVNIDALAEVKDLWHRHYADVLGEVCPGVSGRSVRIVIGHYIQQLIELVVLKLIDNFNMRHVALAGGIFYNVKLNNRILNKIPGTFSVVPLAGDQGCGAGMYEAHVGGFKWGDLKWGKRPSFSNWKDSLSPEDMKKYAPYIRHYGEDQRSIAVYDSMTLLSKNKLVNVVKSNMEFGPRALCSTTTLSMPTNNNVMIINELNERDTVMPMAPVILDENIGYFFDEVIADRVVGSDKYMILTYNYKEPELDLYGGVAHKYPDRNVWSGRPQKVGKEDTFMYGVLSSISNKTKALINTSFNAHGRPIVYDIHSVMDSFKFEFDRALHLNVDLPYLFLCDFDG